MKAACAEALKIGDEADQRRTIAAFMCQKPHWKPALGRERTQVLHPRIATAGRRATQLPQSSGCQITQCRLVEAKAERIREESPREGSAGEIPSIVLCCP